MLKEFREFAMRGNVLDMAVGINCFSTIPIKATRCSHCTSELKGS